MNKLYTLFLFFSIALYGADEETLSPPFLFMLAPIEKTSFTSLNSSKVAKIYKRMGDSFEKGEILIQLEDIIQNSLYQKALAVLEKAQTVQQSKKILFEGKVASRDELVNLNTELKIAENDVIIAKKNLDDCSVIAEYNGRVSFLNVEVGEYPNHEFYYKDKPMMETINEETLLAKILVPSNLIFQIRKGQMVQLKVNEIEGMITAPIIRIGALVDPASATVLIEAEVDNRERRLLGGMTGEARINLEGHP